MPRAFAVLVLARCVNRLGGFSMAFLGVHLGTALGASLAVVGVVLAAFGLATIPSRLLGGYLAGRFGAVPTMVAGLVGCAAAQLVLAAAPTLGWALVGAVLLGLAFEVVEPPSQALVADLVDPADLPSAYALLWSVLAVAGVAAGGIAAVVVRAGIAWLFVVDAVTCLACALLVALLLRAPAAGAEASEPTGRGPMLAAARDRGLLRHTARGTVFATAYMVVVFALPLSVEALRLGPSTTGVLLAVEAAAALAAQPLVRRVRDRVRADATALRLGYGVVAGGLVVAGLAVGSVGSLGTPGLEAVVVLGVGLSVVAVGSTLTLGPLQAGAARLAPAWGRAAHLAVFGLAWGVATTVAPGVVSTLLPHGVAWPWVAAAVLVVALAALPARDEPVPGAPTPSGMTTTTPARATR
ncbi:MFS transporter [Intrasporangium flavum]|uniref:MFS transporter n=1 Tax=Intrasporangium flavum TaxID=1428657 RepID=UPI00096D4889|nr:MFS transporter [Intrasporangium flavum]